MFHFSIEFNHNILEDRLDTALFLVGTHELWAVDSTGASSNVARFESTRDQAAAETRTILIRI
jgi:hypothetical protein